jgi:hypothetical protein
VILEAKADGCFSSTHVLKINGQAVGKFEGRFFSEGLDLSLTGQRRFKFDKSGFFTSQFELKDGETGDVLTEAKPAGFFNSGWALKLVGGDADLKKAGFFSSAYEVRSGGMVLARVDRLGMCERGWRVDGDSLEAPDLLTIGLVYQVMMQRQQRQAAAAGS